MINSYALTDHYHENVAFSDEATIISSTKARNTMVEEGLLRLKRMKNTMMAQANDLSKKLNLSDDNTEKLGIEKLWNTIRVDSYHHRLLPRP